MSDILKCLRAVEAELEQWNRANSPSESGYLIEDVPPGHPLLVAWSPMQRQFGGAVPRPAIKHWRRFLRLVRAEDERAEDEAEWLLQWVWGEIRKHEPEEPDETGRLIAAMGETDAAIVAVAATDLSVEEKLRRIVNLDTRALGWSSERWATLLDCTPQAVRKTEVWKSMQGPNGGEI